MAFKGRDTHCNYFDQGKSIRLLDVEGRRKRKRKRAPYSQFSIILSMEGRLTRFTESSSDLTKQAALPTVPIQEGSDNRIY
jgi:hypothetical protein